MSKEDPIPHGVTLLPADDPTARPIVIKMTIGRPDAPEHECLVSYSGGPLGDARLPSLARDLARAETKGEWASVLLRAIEALHLATGPTASAPDTVREEWERARFALFDLIRRGPPRDARHPRLVLRATHDAFVIALVGCRTQAAATRFLEATYGLSYDTARSRVRRAVAAGLRLQRGPVFGRNPRTKDR